MTTFDPFKNGVQIIISFNFFHTTLPESIDDIWNRILVQSFQSRALESKLVSKMTDRTIFLYILIILPILVLWNINNTRQTNKKHVTLVISLFHPVIITMACLYSMLHIPIKKERRKKEIQTERKKEKERKSHNHNIGLVHKRASCLNEMKRKQFTLTHLI